MSSISETREGFLKPANDDAVDPKNGSSENRPWVGSSPASSEESHSEPLLVIEQHVRPPGSSSLPPFVHPTSDDFLGIALTTLSHEGDTHNWPRPPNGTLSMPDADEMVATLHPCITDMDEDESMSPDGVGSKAAATSLSRATAPPTTAVVEKEVGEYIHSLEQLGSFDSIDWTVRDGSSPMLSGLLRNADHVPRDATEAAPFVTAAATDLPSPEEIGMFQPYQSFASALLPLDHFPLLEMTSSCLLTGPLSTPGHPMRTFPRPPHQTSIFPDPYVSTHADSLGHLKQAPYLQPVSLDLFAQRTPHNAFIDRRSESTSGSAAKVADNESSASRTSGASSSPCSSKSTKKAPPNRKNDSKTMAAPHTDEGSTSAPRRVGRWTREEDEILIAAVAKMRDMKGRVVWASISREYFRGSRNATQCKARWGKALSPAVDRSPFTAEEDAIIADARQRGMRFCDISRLCLPRRPSDRIRFRYTHVLDPSRKEKRDVPWSDAEKQVLIDAQKAMGNKWTTIAMLLPGRSDNDVKNFWYNQKDSIRRAQNRLLVEQNRTQTSPSHSSGEGAASVDPVSTGLDDSPAPTPTAV